MKNQLTTPPLLALLLIIARKELGVKELPPGSNRGPRVEGYLKSVHLGPGYAWCAAFVYWCFEQASAGLNRVNPLPRTGSCLDHWNKTRGQKITSQQALTDPTLIEPGDVFIIRSKGIKGHTGIVVGICDGYIHTIEGNTNAFHSSEGEGVLELQRKIESINVGFIRYT
jgi:cell wall-associated NlpC family hydrolase